MIIELARRAKTSSRGALAVDTIGGARRAIGAGAPAVRGGRGDPGRLSCRWVYDRASGRLACRWISAL
jgi:hypothetical protein